MKTLLALLLMSTAVVAQSQAGGQDKPLTDAEKQSVLAVRFVRAKLNDPESFRFSSVIAHLIDRKDGSSAYAVCIDGSIHNPTRGLTPLVSYVLPPYQNDPMTALMGSSDTGSADGGTNIEVYNAMCKNKKGENTTNTVRRALRTQPQ
jgi:hypothetical protein